MTQIGSKLSPEPKARVTNIRSEAFFIYSRGVNTIFLPGEAENTTFAIGHRKQNWYFRPARQKLVDLGSKSKECLRSHIIVARAKGEGDKYVI